MNGRGVYHENRCRQISFRLDFFWCKLGHVLEWLFTLYVTVWVLQGTETFTVVTCNLENYFLADFGTRKAKSEALRMKVVEFL